MLQPQAGILECMRSAKTHIPDASTLGFLALKARMPDSMIKVVRIYIIVKQSTQALSTPSPKP